MPKFQIEMSDGRKFQIEADTQPTEAEVMAHLNGAGTDPRPSADTYAGGFTRSLGDTAYNTAKGIGIGALKAFDPRNVYNAVATATNPVNLMNAAKGAGQFISDAAHGTLDPETGGEAIGGLATGLIAPRLGPPVVRGLRRIAPGVASAAGTAADVGWGALKGGASNIPIASPIVKGMIKGGQAALDERAIANVDTPANVQRAFRATTQAAGKRGVQLSPEDLLTPPDQPDVRLPFPAGDTGAPSGAVAGPNRMGAASYGPYGDRGAWIQNKIAETSGLPPKIGDLAAEMQAQTNPWPTDAEIAAAPKPTTPVKPAPRDLTVLSAGEQRGLRDLGDFQDLLHGPNADLPAAMPGHSGNGSYVDPVPVAATPTPSILTTAEQRFLEQLNKQQPPLAVPPSAAPSAFPSPLEQQLRASLDRGR